MITIYKKKENIPKKSKLVELNDIYFNRHTSQNLDLEAKRIITEIDGATLCEKYKIVSKFQKEVLNIDRLSTGCKTALNIYYNPEIVFSIKECGDNAIDVIYDLQQGKIYSEYPVISFDMSSVRAVDDNGEHTFESYEELKEWWEDV